MTAELEELLAAAKAIVLQLRELRLLRVIRSDERSAGIRLNIAIRAFEEARDKINEPDSGPVPTDPYDFENDGLRKEP
jgi:hypothetical protein